MKLDEIQNRIAECTGVSAQPDGVTFVYQVPARPTFFFYRPVDTDTVLGTSVMNLELPAAQELANATLAFASDVELPATDFALWKYSGLSCPGVGFDTLLARSASVAEFRGIPKADFLSKITLGYYPIMGFEFCGDETVPEAQARLSFMKISDATRDPAPALAGRFRKQSGARSKNKFMGVMRESALVKLVRELPKDGGNVEVENFEHEQCTFEGKSGSPEVTARFLGEQRAQGVDDAVAFLHDFARRGAVSWNVQ